MPSEDGRKEAKKAGDILDQSLERMTPVEHKEDTILSGFDDLDEGTDGFRKGTITIIGGRPSMGKTSLAHTILRDKVVNDSIPSAYFTSYSMCESLNRLILVEAGIAPYKVKKNMLKEEEKEDIYSAAERFEEVPLFLDDRSIRTIARLKERIEILKEEHDIELVVIDSLQDIRTTEGYGRREKLTRIMRILNYVAGEQNISLILLSGISDRVEERNPPRPKLIDVGQSDAVTEQADLVILMYRDFYYTGDEDMEGITELIVAKNARGLNFTAEIFFEKGTLEFKSLDPSPTPKV